MNKENEKNINIRRDIPPTQDGMVLENDIRSFSIENRSFSCFGFSLQGDSHKRAIPRIPCQDYNDFRIVEGANVVIAAIADGVGSCSFSHWGAYLAVKTAVNYTEEMILKLSGDRSLSFEKTFEHMKTIMHDAFIHALNTVEDFADSQGVPVSSLQSTLTLAAYDGKVLLCEHAGDDGIVAQFSDGNVKMITERSKGEEANSVFSLQSKKWYFSAEGIKNDCVTAFVMVTDGVLDDFVLSLHQSSVIKHEFSQRIKDCMNGIYYPFMKPAVYSCDGKPRNAAERLAYYLNILNSAEYRNRVTDDITFVSVIDSGSVAKGNIPQFNREEYKTLIRDIKMRRDKVLYPNKNPSPVLNPFSFTSRKKPNSKSLHPIPEPPQKNEGLFFLTYRKMIILIAAVALFFAGVKVGQFFSHNPKEETLQPKTENNNDNPPIPEYITTNYNGNIEKAIADAKKQGHQDGLNEGRADGLKSMKDLGLDDDIIEEIDTTKEDASKIKINDVDERKYNNSFRVKDEDHTRSCNYYSYDDILDIVATLGVGHFKLVNIVISNPGNDDILQNIIDCYKKYKTQDKTIYGYKFEANFEFDEGDNKLYPVHCCYYNGTLYLRLIDMDNLFHDKGVNIYFQSDIIIISKK